MVPSASAPTKSTDNGAGQTTTCNLLEVRSFGAGRVTEWVQLEYQGNYAKWMQVYIYRVCV